jgi:hypothetical protein
MPERGSADWEVIAAILDAGFLASVGFNVDGQPFVIPMMYGRSERSLYLHGAAASRLMKALEAGAPACLSVTLVDGLVLARSAFHHSMNYRSVVAFGVARPITEPRRKIEALRLMSEHLLPGRWNDTRGPNKDELRQTTVLELPIDEASTKTREGPPNDAPADLHRQTWAGILPLTLAAGEPVPHAQLSDGVGLPDYLSAAARCVRFDGL